MHPQAAWGPFASLTFCKNRQPRAGSVESGNNMTFTLLTTSEENACLGRSRRRTEPTQT